jgi:mannosidase alpha-like ER degradation enhancer 1
VGGVAWTTYYLYQATRDPFYLRVGERVLNDLRRRTKTKCGFATLKNVETGEVCADLGCIVERH